MPFVIYRRHTADCLKKLNEQGIDKGTIKNWRKCRCAVWYNGSHNGVYHPRKSLGVYSWEAAQAKIRELETTGMLAPTRVSLTVEEALAKWQANNRAIGVRESSIGFYDYSFVRHLVRYAASRGLLSIRQLTADMLTDWRAEWKLADTTAAIRLKTLKQFCRYAKRLGWLDTDPSEVLERPRNIKKDPTLPLTNAEVSTLLEAIPRFISGRDALKADTFLRLTEVMLKTGLRISDAVLFDLRKLEWWEDRDVWLYTTIQHKTGTEVTCILDSELVEPLKRLTPISPAGLFMVEDHQLADWTRNLSKRYANLGKFAGVPHVHPHRFRDTFAVEQLNSGLRIDYVSKLLGHSSVAVTEKYYAPWVRSRRDALVDDVLTVRERSKRGNVVPIRKKRVS